MAANNLIRIPLMAAACLLGASLLVPVDVAEAARGGGNARASGQTSVNRPAANTANRGGGNARANASSGGREVNRNTTVNRNTNVNVNTTGNGNWDNDGCCDDDWGDNDWDDNPLAKAAVVTGTIAAIGSIVRQPPANCVPVSHQNVTYQQCGSTWYQPQYSGSNVQYMVVSPPY